MEGAMSRESGRAMEGTARRESGRVTEALENGWEVNENKSGWSTWRSCGD
jgi:hypothetical protein